MRPTREITIEFPADLHEHLTALAARRGMSFSALVLEACAIHGARVPSPARWAAVRELASMALPVGDPAQLAVESSPAPENLLPPFSHH